MKYAIIIGAGPAGLTAAYELLKRTDIIPIILEKSSDIGGISKTVNYKGNRIDIGGHRFFSKSDRVMKWWLNIMPLEQGAPQEFVVNYQHKSRVLDRKGLETDAYSSKDPDNVMLLRKRLSRIYFLRKFFTYPIQLSFDTLNKLGLSRTIAIIFSYLKAQLFPRKPEKSLEDFMINRFGVKLYQLFFKDYTEKVWGVPCQQISAEWGAQRIKGVSISKTIQHAITKALKKENTTDLSQKGTETSLIEQFLYPKYGPGQLWEEVARQVQAMGGQIHLHQDVDRIYTNGNQVTAVSTLDRQTNQPAYYEGDYFFSTMPVKELIAGLQAAVPDTVRDIASGLQYRDFITVGVLLHQLEPAGNQVAASGGTLLPDTWIYIQEKDVRVGRLQIFNNWSPYMVKDPNTVWIGMEYFCNKGDGFWELSENELKRIGVTELEKMGLARVEYVIDTTVIRMENTYPAYFGTYTRFSEIREYTDLFQNLFLVGRNGMHKYNNSDHSMLTAMVAVDNIVEGATSKENIWSINTEQEYHEEKEITNEVNPYEVKDTKIPALARVSEIQRFKAFLFGSKLNRIFLWSSLAVFTLTFTVFKYFYPFPSFINGDSYTYLETAAQNLAINTYPIGYSKYLRLVSVISTNDTFLILLQYGMLTGSLLFFFFTINYFFKPGKIVQITVFLLFVANPVFLYLANYISSDALFISLSVCWFTLLIWLVQKPSFKITIWQGLLLFFAFTVRYNALYYPLIAGVAIILSRQKVLEKVSGVALSFLLVLIFIGYTSTEYKKLTGIRQFTPFSGWQIANNAMYAYRDISSKDVKPVPKRFKELDSYVRAYIDTTPEVIKNGEKLMGLSTIYMWDTRSPFQKYMKDYSKKNATRGKLKKWAQVAPLYEDYGKYLIKMYPKSYFKNYILPNFFKFYTPPVEFLRFYSTGRDSIQEVARYWFGYNSNKIKSRFKDFRVNSLDALPILNGIVNCIFLFGVFVFIALKDKAQSGILSRNLMLVFSLWVINFCFSIFASPIALRFQVFSQIVILCFDLLIIEHLVKAAIASESSQNIIHPSKIPIPT